MFIHVHFIYEHGMFHDGIHGIWENPIIPSENPKIARESPSNRQAQGAVANESQLTGDVVWIGRLRMVGPVGDPCTRHSL